MNSGESALKIIGAISLISILTSAMAFFFLKGLNEYINIMAYEFLDLLAFWGVNLSIEQLWIVLGVIMFVIILLLASKRD